MGGFSLVTRQTNDPLNSNDTNNDGFDDRRFYYNSFWYTTTGVIVKWTIFLSFMTILLLWVILGKWHAKRRMRKGLPPLAYHRWLVTRAELARVDPRYAYPQPQTYTTYRPDYHQNQSQPGYNMHPMPPPVYNPNEARPPMYDGPEGATKTAPSQWAQEPTHRPTNGPANNDDYTQPPPGPPPSAVTANHTGSSNPFRG